MSEWISVNNRLPAERELVLTIDENGYIYVARLFLDIWFINCQCSEGSSIYRVTHWMPLPPNPPEEK